jgi:hypothetical protein
MTFRGFILSMIALAIILAFTPAPRAQTAFDVAPKVVKWNAVAASAWRVTRRDLGKRVALSAAGFAEKLPSKAEAEAAAIGECESKGGKKCEVVVWNTGCFFITAYRTPRGAGYVGGQHAVDTTEKCKKKKWAVCEPIRGGCL